MFKDLRHGFRMLLHAKGWTVVVVLSLALGIGANTALFSITNGLLLKKVDVADPDSLVRLRSAGRNDMANSTSDYGSTNQVDGQDVRTTFSYPMYKQFVADNRTMTDLFACAPYGRVNVVVDGQAEIASAFISSGNYYRVLGVSASRGRTIDPDDDKPTANAVAVISNRYWRSRFGSDPAAVGKVVRVNNVPVTIVGVLPSGFSGVQQPVGEPPDIALPLALDAQLTGGPPPPRLDLPTYWWLQIMGRLKPGMTAAQVQGNLEGVFQTSAQSGMTAYLASLTDEQRSTARNRDRTRVPRFLAGSGSHGVYDVGATNLQSVTILSFVVALVLLIVCANVANLLLSRATTRQKEISVRLSLGATRWRLIRQLLTESVLLASMGGALGVLVGYWGKGLLPLGTTAAAMDWRVLGFTLAVTVATGVVFGIAPALRATRVNVNVALKEHSRGVIGSRSLLGRALLIVQVAVSLVLLVGAGLFLRTVENLRSVDVGFNPQRLVLFRVDPRLNRYDDARLSTLYDEMMDRLRTVSGVRSVSLSQPALLSGSVSSTSIFVEGRTYAIGQSDSINRVVASPSFFETMEIPFLTGRGFLASDTSTAPKVAVINEAAARKYFPNESPVGRRFGTSPETSSQFEIVGILRDARYNSVRDPAPPTMYLPHMQSRPGTAVFEVRSVSDPAGVMSGIREAVRQIDPNLPLMDMSTQMEQVERRFTNERAFARVYTLFGALALSVAALGLFGLMSYSVARRTNEIGIRMALGAERLHVLGLILRESMTLVLLGVVVGVGLAYAAGRYLTTVATLLFDLAPTDVVTIAVATAVMTVVSAAAGYLPARRASRVDPMVALHYE